MTIGVIGLGAMGLGIAQVFAQSGQDVIGFDASPAARDSAKDRLAAQLAPRVAKGALSAEAMAQILDRLVVVEAMSGLGPSDMLIEAVIERLDVKVAVLGDAMPHLRPNTVIATNTSSLSVARIAAGLAHPQNVLGLHFFNPAPVMKLVELVPHVGTSAQALAQARAWSEAAGKTVVQCPDRPGFIVNRCARPFYGEALALLESGFTAAQIDAAMLAAGYRLGPFALIDLVGADINLAATQSLCDAMQGHPRYHVFEALQAQVARGDLGRKTGKGFVFPAQIAAHENGDIALQIEAALLNEAAWLMTEGGTDAAGIDTALRLGLNFPRGPFEILAARGRGVILAKLAALEATAPPHLKTRYLPAPFLTTGTHP